MGITRSPAPSPPSRSFPDFKKAGELTEPTLYFHLDEMLKAYDLIKFKKNKSIIDNIVYLGLRRKTEDVLEGKKKKNGK